MRRIQFHHGETLSVHYIKLQVGRLDCPKLLLSATVPNNCLQELESLYGNLIVICDSVFRDNLVLEIRERSRGCKFMTPYPCI
jgi:hypothetical protein